MTKRKFLVELEKRLAILNEEERKDIINEYKDIIEEKVKHGKTEKEAIMEFGDFDSLVEEILIAYKINPKFNNESKVKGVKEAGSNFIKEAAKELTNLTSEVVEEAKNSGIDMSLEKIFEVMIKVLILLIGLSLLRLPFFIISELGAGILRTDVIPFIILPFIWKFVVWILYIVSCILVVSYVFKDSLFSKKKDSKKEAKEQAEKVKEDVKEQVNKVKQEINDEVEKTKKEISEKIEATKIKVEKKEYTNPISSIFLILIKIFLIFTFFIPAFGFLMGWTVLFSLALYFLIKGVNTIGIILICIGGYVIAGFFIDLVGLIFNKAKKITYMPILIGFFFVILGSIFTVDHIFKVEYINEVPSSFQKEVIKKEYINKDEFKITSNYSDVNYIVDESLVNKEIMVSIEYYKNYVDMSLEENNYELKIVFADKERMPNGIIDNFVEEIKNNKIYNYSNLYDKKVTVYASSEIINKLNK